MTKQNAFRNLKSAVVWMLMFALVWNSAVLPISAASSRDRRSSKPPSKPAAKLVQGGGSFIIWGPQQVVRQPINTTYYANFPLPAGALPPYTMTVSNGAPNGTRKVTQACVKLNGANVLSPTCYHSLNPTPQTRTVSLLANNAVQVQLIGPSLSYITITVTGSQGSFAISPTSGNQGQTQTATLTGTGTSWVQGHTAASFGSGGGEITVNSLTINSATSATAQIAISATAALGPRTVTMTTGSQVVSAVDAFTVEALVAADMKHSVLTIRAVTLARQPSGEVTVMPVVGRPVVVDLKAGRKVTNGPDAIRLAETVTIVPITRATQALDITWEPKNDKKDDPSNTVLVLLGKEAQVAVNGYIEGAPVR